MFVPDPIGLKLVESYARPGGNATGLVTFGRDLVGKRLQFIKEIVPGLSRFALLVNSDQVTTPVFIRETTAAATELGMSVQVFDARTNEMLEPTFDAMVKAEMQSLITASGGTIFQVESKYCKVGARSPLAVLRVLPGDFRGWRTHVLWSGPD